MSNNLEFKKVRDFGEIVTDTFVFITQNFKPLFKVFFYLCGFFLVAGIIATIMQQLGLQKMVTGGGNPFGISRLENVFTINYLLVILFSMGIYASITVSVLSFIALYIQKGNIAPTPDEVWGYFKYYFFRVFFSNIVVGIVLIIAFALCLVPGIYIFPAVSLFFPVMILENGEISYSFGRAYKLVRDQWMPTAGAILVIWIIAYACMSFASIPGIILTLVGTFLPSVKAWSPVFVIVGTIIQYVSYVFMIIPILGASLCYFNLVERQESTGLMDRINELGTHKNPFNSPEEY